MNFLPGPSLGGPVSISHEDGASTDVTGRCVSSKRVITEGKGGRRGPEKENPVCVNLVLEGEDGRGVWDGKEGERNIPKIASTTWSVSLSAEGKSSVNGMERFLSCVARR